MSSKTIDRAHYERAACFAPAKLAGQLSGWVSDGYWIDDRRYFFCVGEADAAGVIVRHPKIADAVAGTVARVIDTDALAALISDHRGEALDAGDLALAQYDMPDVDALVVTLGPYAWHVALSGPTLIRKDTIDPVPALYSPDGKYAALLKDHDVWVQDRMTGTERQLSSGGEAYNAYGTAPESGTSPLTGRRHAMPNGLWSADSQWFVTHRIDERHLPESGLTEHVPEDGQRARPHVFKVSSPDAELARLEVVAFHLPSGRSVSSAGHPLIVQIYSPFALKQCWFAGDQVYFLDWGRFASEVALVEMRLDTGAVRTVLAETAQDGWIDSQPVIVDQPLARVVPETNELIWWSQADGYGHLYLHDLESGMLRNRVTQGRWMVREIVHVDAAKRCITFLASGFEADTDPGQRRLCAVNFDGSGFETLLDGADISAAPDPVSGCDQHKLFRPSYAPRGASPTGDYIVVQAGTIDEATRTLLLDVATDARIELAASNIAALWTAPKPQPFEALASDGVTKLRGAMFFPTGFDPGQSYPLVDYIYPGPQLNWLARRFPNFVGATAQSVAELGTIAIVLETRGMPNRDRAFHQAGHGRMLEPQLSDHAAAIEQLCRCYAFLDRDRVGIFGQSGGGHATARAMFDYPETFKVGVAVCGNHDSRNYVAHWLDKYGGRPGTPERDEQSNVAVAHKLQGKLCLIHGDMDENVHPAHTLALSAALIAAGKEFDQLIVPNVGHAVLMECPYALQRLWNFFARNLIGAEPPVGFTINWTPADANAAMAMRHLA